MTKRPLQARSPPIWYPTHAAGLGVVARRRRYGLAANRAAKPAMINSRPPSALETFATAGVVPTEAALCLTTMNDDVIGFAIEHEARAGAERRAKSWL